MQRDDVIPAQKKMLLSDATLTGIYMTGNGRSIMVTCEIINVCTYLSLSSTFMPVGKGGSRGFTRTPPTLLASKKILSTA